MCEILFINIIIIIHVASDWQEAGRITPINFSFILLIFPLCVHPLETHGNWKLRFLHLHRISSRINYCTKPFLNIENIYITRSQWIRISRAR